MFPFLSLSEPFPNQCFRRRTCFTKYGTPNRPTGGVGGTCHFLKNLGKLEIKAQAGTMI